MLFATAVILYLVLGVAFGAFARRVVTAAACVPEVDDIDAGTLGIVVLVWPIFATIGALIGLIAGLGTLASLISKAGR